MSNSKIKEFNAPEKYPKDWLVPVEEREGCKAADKDALDKVADLLGVQTTTAKRQEG